jgi:hypothetical protein
VGRGAVKIDEYNCHQLTPEAREELYKRVLRGLAEYYEEWEGEEGVQLNLLRWLLYSLDEGDSEDDLFDGELGWRSSVLGEDD